MKWVNMIYLILFQVNNKDNYWPDATIVGFELIHQFSVLTAEFEQELAWWTKLFSEILTNFSQLLRFILKSVICFTQHVNLSQTTKPNIFLYVSQNTFWYAY